jgi:glycosyltransferase involved in cell wall biosynthesis
MRSLITGDEAVRRMREAVARLTREERFDLMLFSGKRTFPAIEQLRTLPIVADMCDATSIRIRGSMRYARLRRLPQLLVEYQQVRRVERALVRTAAHLLFASGRDHDALLGLAQTRATVVPNGVDLEFWRRSSGERGADTLVFTGAMDYPPNTDAALVLIEGILPLVRRTVPDARVLIVGRDPPPQLVRAGQQPGVTVTGFVEDVRPYLEQATVFVAPLRFGAGIQNKVLEAMAMEVPVIASPLAADGVRAEGGQEAPVHVAHDQQQFAQLIIRRLAERATTAAPDTEARRYVEQHFVWRRSGELLEQVLTNLASGQAPLASHGVYR